MGILNHNKLSKSYSVRNWRINESDSTKAVEGDLDHALKLVSTKIGGNDEMSFDSITQALDRIPSDLLKEAELNPTIQKIYLNLLDPDTMEIVNKYVDSGAEELDDIIKRNSGEEGSLKILSRDDSYVSDFNHSANIVVRFEKLYTIYSRSDQDIGLDSNTEILKSLRLMDAGLNLSKLGLKGTGKIGKIGGVDDSVDPDLFEIILSGEESKVTLIPKDSITTIIKNSKELSSKVTGKYESEHKRRMQEVATKSSDSIKNWYSWASKTFTNLTDDVKSADDSEEAIDSAREFQDNTGGSVFNMVFNYGDSQTTMANELGQAERNIESDDTSRRGIRRKKQIFRKIKTAIATAALPAVQSGEIQRQGDYYELFNVLREEREDWMDTIMLNDVFSGQTGEYNAFKDDLNIEDPSESAQLNYLNGCIFWTVKFIESSYISNFNEKEMDNYKTTLESISLEKKTEIRNYYLSKGFNLSNFRSVQIKPEIDIPLYKTVKLSISDEDRKKESPMLNFLKGAKSTIFSLLGGGIYVDTAALAKGRRFASQNKAVVGSLNQAIKGIVGIAGGKQAARNYDTAMNNDKKDDKVQEDMLSPMDSPSSAMVPMEGPGSTFQNPMTLSGDMDMFSLAGPSGGNSTRSRKTKRKKSGKKKKGNTIDFSGSSKVLNFKDFMKKSGY